MLPEIITFNKTLQYRLQEYRQLLESVDTSCSDIIEVWSSIFEDLAIIGVNWQALWILSEESCKKYDLIYPTAVIVNVNSFCWHELTANITVLAVQEDIVLPSSLDVPVIELHPIKVQDYDETDLKNIEDWLDKCRYFFRNLWYPWDAKVNVSMMDWCDSHLRKRLVMQYDMKNGVFDKTIVNYLKSLLSEVQNLNLISECTLSSDEDERLIVVKNYIRRKIIKAELDLFEEPDLRHGMVLLKSMEKCLRMSECNPHDKEARFVWMKGTCNELISNLKIARTLIDDNISLKVFGSLQEAIDTSNVNDIVLLPEGIYVLNALKGINSGGIIRGFDMETTIITADQSLIQRAILLECFGAIELQNLTIKRHSGIAIQVFDGDIKISKCKIMSKTGSNSKGIVVVSGCNLYIEECELMGFDTGIILQEGASVSITDSRITSCREGIKIADKTALTLSRVTISSCSSFAIQVETSDFESEVPYIGDLNLFNKIALNCKTNFTSVLFQLNKNDVVIKRKEKFLLYDESSDHNVSNEVICISDKDESEYDMDAL